MLDHVGLEVREYARSRAFYEQALAPLGYQLMLEPVERVGGFGDHMPFFWIAERGEPGGSTHVAFSCPDRQTVDAFHSAAVAAGGRDNGAPGPRPSTTSTTTAPTCSIPTATTSKRSATNRARREA
jgi:catechol 2,3-dioxygenase-like lactoylglutathione lyase family enzyme